MAEQETSLVTSLLKKLSSLDTGSFLAALKKFAWPLVVIFVFVAVVIFFLSYSLARHKRMVFRLTVELQAARTEMKIKDLKIKAQQEQFKLAFLKKEGLQEQEKRAKILQNLKKIDEYAKKSKADLEQERKKIKSEDNLDALLEQAKKLTKETL